MTLQAKITWHQMQDRPKNLSVHGFKNSNLQDIILALKSCRLEFRGSETPAPDRKSVSKKPSKAHSNALQTDYIDLYQATLYLNRPFPHFGQNRAGLLTLPKDPADRKTIFSTFSEALGKIVKMEKSVLLACRMTAHGVSWNIW